MSLARTSARQVPTARTVAGYQRAPPWAVGTASAFNFSARQSLLAHAPNPLPHVLGIDRGRPSRTPSRLFAASPARVRSPIALRSHCATEAITFATNSPEGVERSTPRSSATRLYPLVRASSSSPAKSISERESRTSGATGSGAAFDHSLASQHGRIPQRPTVQQQSSGRDLRRVAHTVPNNAGHRLANHIGCDDGD